MIDSNIDLKILEMFKNRKRLHTILLWLQEWDNFSQLDEQIILCYILNVLNENNFAVSRNEVRRTFNKFYNEKFHGDKRAYLNWIYTTFRIKTGTLVRSNQIRHGHSKTPPLSQTTSLKFPTQSKKNQSLSENTPKVLPLRNCRFLSRFRRCENEV